MYEQDLEIWDEGEDEDDDQRRADAQLIAQYRSLAPALAADLQRVVDSILDRHREDDDGHCTTCLGESDPAYQYQSVLYPCGEVRSLQHVLRIAS